jgi:hypothetical protein
MSRLAQAEAEQDQAIQTLANLFITIRDKLEPHERKLAADQLLTLDGRSTLTDQTYDNIEKK